MAGSLAVSFYIETQIYFDSPRSDTDRLSFFFLQFRMTKTPEGYLITENSGKVNLSKLIAGSGKAESDFWRLKPRNVGSRNDYGFM